MSDSVRPHRRQPTGLPHPWDSPGKNTGVGCHFLLRSMKVKSQSEVAQSFPTPRDPLDCSPPDSSVHGILQARILEWVAIPFLRQLCQPRDWTWVFCIAGRFFTVWATRDARQCRGYGLDSWSGKISHAMEQVSLCSQSPRTATKSSPHTAMKTQHSH